MRLVRQVEMAEGTRGDQPVAASRRAPLRLSSCRLGCIAGRTKRALGVSVVSSAVGVEANSCPELVQAQAIADELQPYQAKGGCFESCR